MPIQGDWSGICNKNSANDADSASQIRVSNSTIVSTFGSSKGSALESAYTPIALTVLLCLEYKVEVLFVESVM